MYEESKDMYEFVEKSEWKPVKNTIENELFPIAREYLWDRAGIRFNHNLIGSGKRALIMREINSNRGFDLDYDLVIKKNITDEFHELELKELFRNAFNHSVVNSEFDNPRNSTSVLTIPSHKVESLIRNGHYSSNGVVTSPYFDICNIIAPFRPHIIQYSCDLAIVYDTKEGRHCLHVEKNIFPNRAYFQLRPKSKNMKKKEDYIKTYPNGWNKLRMLYEERKNDPRYRNKASFQIYTESINDLYNNLKQ